MFRAAGRQLGGRAGDAFDRCQGSESQLSFEDRLLLWHVGRPLPRYGLLSVAPSGNQPGESAASGATKLQMNPLAIAFRNDSIGPASGASRRAALISSISLWSRALSLHSQHVCPKFSSAPHRQYA